MSQLATKMGHDPQKWFLTHFITKSDGANAMGAASIAQRCYNFQIFVRRARFMANTSEAKIAYFKSSEACQCLSLPLHIY